jgi:hypothetical protein
MGRDREEKMFRQLRTEEERKAMARMREMAESGGAIATERDLNDALLALRLLGKKFDAKAVLGALEQTGWITQMEERTVIKKIIPLSTLGQIIDKSK